MLTLLLLSLLLPQSGAVPTAPGPILAPGGDALPGRDALQELQTWVRRYRRNDRTLSLADESEVKALIQELPTPHPGRRRVETALMAMGNTHGLRELAIASMAERIRTDPCRDLDLWLGNEVLGEASSQSLETRIFAAELAGAAGVKSQHPPLISGLLLSARDPDPDLARAARSALIGWPSAEVHRALLERVEKRSLPHRVLERHLALLKANGTPLGPMGQERLALLTGRRLFSKDWRDASRACSLLAYLELNQAAPILIEGLSLWQRRRESGTGSLRISHDIAGVLKNFSGRSMGPYPERWLAWWEGVRAGRIQPLSEDGLEPGGAGSVSAPVTVATFFSLRPLTDRVVFVIDRSSSMTTPFGTGGRTRYEEAVNQMVTFLEACVEPTRFGVTLFNNKAGSMRAGLTDCRPGTIAAARRWLMANRPAGGTLLSAGVEKAVRVGRDGMVDLDAFEADTVIVLCDGATPEGPAWARKWLEKVNGEARLVFHCVEIGRQGNGTLKALADGSGGDWVQVDA